MRKQERQENLRTKVFWSAVGLAGVGVYEFKTHQLSRTLHQVGIAALQFKNGINNFISCVQNPNIQCAEKIPEAISTVPVKVPSDPNRPTDFVDFLKYLGGEYEALFENIGKTAHGFLGINELFKGVDPTAIIIGGVVLLLSIAGSAAIIKNLSNQKYKMKIGGGSSGVSGGTSTKKIIN